jgi:hypothetical protein
MRCDRCGTREATVAVVDLPENHGALMFGDPVAGRVLCDACLDAMGGPGQWDEVQDLVAVDRVAA